MKPEILIVGAGAVGGYYGARLAQGGARVSALCRSDYNAVRSNGIIVRSVAGDCTFIPASTIQSISDYKMVPDYIIISTKVLPDIDIPGMIRSIVRPGTAIVHLQNGIEIEEPSMAAFPDNEIIGAIAFICASRPSPGCIAHEDYGRVTIGRYPSGSSAKTESLADLFRTAGIQCDIDPDIITARWKKLVWNASLNPISVLGGGADTREIMESPPALQLAREVMAEVVMLAGKSGHPLPDSIIDKTIHDTISMKPTKTSMLQDYEGGRPLETEALLGNALGVSRRVGVQVPHIESLYGLLKLVGEKKRRGA
ncbi:MAG TPA: 2-dehydropantoate 2-reductase [Spirochaetota bacterium]|nr:2-dehydropantoate 2-reductase [Spirochaetota bacterium]HOD14789.1 2-dehydropantoate 2-reductase [Spirochaetota bacterium]HPG49113.1 2-dehydropantoate 2-reductase [Spirochaetota bacterium]HPN11164.1 2-dehydropantoate 2-reductase [Spirochaetota bacterium]HQL82627.1 2-dehydropantoate 2-reductase [Spirochaetota bacterium]